MKIWIPLVVLAICACYYWETRKQQPPPPPAPVAEASPTPALPKSYYHSALDASAMPSNVHTGTGYYSMDQNSVWKGSTVADGTAPRSVYSAQGSAVSNAPR